MSELFSEEKYNEYKSEIAGLNKSHSKKAGVFGLGIIFGLTGICLLVFDHFMHNSPNCYNCCNNINIIIVFALLELTAVVCFIIFYLSQKNEAHYYNEIIALRNLFIAYKISTNLDDNSIINTVTETKGTVTTITNTKKPSAKIKMQEEIIQALLNRIS